MYLSRPTSPAHSHQPIVTVPHNSSPSISPVLVRRRYLLMDGEPVRTEYQTRYEGRPTTVVYGEHPAHRRDISHKFLALQDQYKILEEENIVLNHRLRNSEDDPYHSRDMWNASIAREGSPTGRMSPSINVINRLEEELSELRSEQSRYQRQIKELRQMVEERSLSQQHPQTTHYQSPPAHPPPPPTVVSHSQHSEVIHRDDNEIKALRTELNRARSEIKRLVTERASELDDSPDREQYKKLLMELNIAKSNISKFKEQIIILEGKLEEKDLENKRIHTKLTLFQNEDGSTASDLRRQISHAEEVLEQQRGDIQNLKDIITEKEKLIKELEQREKELKYQHEQDMDELHRRAIRLEQEHTWALDEMRGKLELAMSQNTETKEELQHRMEIEISRSVEKERSRLEDLLLENEKSVEEWRNKAQRADLELQRYQQELRNMQIKWDEFEHSKQFDRTALEKDRLIQDLKRHIELKDDEIARYRNQQILIEDPRIRSRQSDFDVIQDTTFSNRNGDITTIDLVNRNVEESNSITNDVIVVDRGYDQSPPALWEPLDQTPSNLALYNRVTTDVHADYRKPADTKKYSTVYPNTSKRVVGRSQSVSNEVYQDQPLFEADDGISRSRSEILRDEKTPVLGVSIRVEYSDEGQRLVVDSIVPEGPAFHSGVLLEDVLVAWNGILLDSEARFQSLMARTRPGSTVMLNIVRSNDRRMTIPVVMGSMKTLADRWTPTTNGPLLSNKETKSIPSGRWAISNRTMVGSQDIIVSPSNAAGRRRSSQFSPKRMWSNDEPHIGEDVTWPIH